MEVGDAVRRRRMVRRFDPDRPVPAESLEAVVEAMVRAPSAGHTQAVCLVIWGDAGDRADFWATATPQPEHPPSSWLSRMQTAPVLLSIWVSPQAYLDRYAEPDKGWTDKNPERWSAPYWYVDAGMAAYAGLLTAVDRGLGACFFGIPPTRQAAVRARFAVPAVQLSIGVLALGYAAERWPQGSSNGRPRRARTERVFRGRWMGP